MKICILEGYINSSILRDPISLQINKEDNNHSMMDNFALSNDEMM